LESLIDLADTIGPLADEDFLPKPSTAWRRWSIKAISPSLAAARILTTWSHLSAREDVNRLGDNVVLILNTIKDMTQPE
jgi:hypothetical protein